MYELTLKHRLIQLVCFDFSMIALDLGEEFEPSFLQNASYVATMFVKHNDGLCTQLVEHLA
jgi:hypothetical protein